MLKVARCLSEPNRTEAEIGTFEASGLRGDCPLDDLVQITRQPGVDFEAEEDIAFRARSMGCSCRDRIAIRGMRQPDLAVAEARNRGQAAIDRPAASPADWNFQLYAFGGAHLDFVRGGGIALQ
jgi:hypothetical protein